MLQKLIKKCLIYLDVILKCPTFAPAKQESWFVIDRLNLSLTDEETKKFQKSSIEIW